MFPPLNPTRLMTQVDKTNRHTPASANRSLQIAAICFCDSCAGNKTIERNGQNNIIKYLSHLIIISLGLWATASARNVRVIKPSCMEVCMKSHFSLSRHLVYANNIHSFTYGGKNRKRNNVCVREREKEWENVSSNHHFGQCSKTNTSQTFVRKEGTPYMGWNTSQNYRNKMCDDAFY